MPDLVEIPAEMATESSSVLAWAKAVTITSPDQMQAVSDRLRAVKSLGRRIADFFAPMKKRAAEAHKEICQTEKGLLGPLDEAERLVKAAMLTYQREEDRKRQEEARRLQAEADERARKERERLAKQAAKLKTPELREQRLAQAAQVVAPVVLPSAPPPKPAGVVTRRRWTFRVTDAAQVPREFLMVDEQKLSKLAQALGPDAKVAGVEFYEAQTVAVR